MGKGLDIELVKENYRRLSDQELIRAATQNANGLTPEALAFIKEEIERRNLGTHVANAVDAQNRQFTIGEIDEYCNLMRGLPCPSCGRNEQLLNATLLHNVVSFLIVTTYSKKIKIACPPCLDKANISSTVNSSIFGWWGFPWGIVRTIQAISGNIKSRNTHYSDDPNPYFRAYTLGKIGQIGACRHQPESLQRIISQP